MRRPNQTHTRVFYHAFRKRDPIFAILSTIDPTEPLIAPFIHTGHLRSLLLKGCRPSSHPRLTKVINNAIAHPRNGRLIYLFLVLLATNGSFITEISKLPGVSHEAYSSFIRDALQVHIVRLLHAQGYTDVSSFVSFLRALYVGRLPRSRFRDLQPPLRLEGGDGGP